MQNAAWIINAVDDAASKCSIFDGCEVWTSTTNEKLAAIFSQPHVNFKGTAYNLSKCNIYYITDFSDLLSRLGTQSSHYKNVAVVIDVLTLCFDDAVMPLHRAALQDRLTRMQKSGVTVLQPLESAFSEPYTNTLLDRYIQSIQ